MMFDYDHILGSCH